MGLYHCESVNQETSLASQMKILKMYVHLLRLSHSTYREIALKISKQLNIFYKDFSYRFLYNSQKLKITYLANGS